MLPRSSLLARARPVTRNQDINSYDLSSSFPSRAEYQDPLFRLVTSEVFTLPLFLSLVTQFSEAPVNTVVTAFFFALRPLRCDSQRAFPAHTSVRSPGSSSWRVLFNSSPSFPSPQKEVAGAFPSQPARLPPRTSILKRKMAVFKLFCPLPFLQGGKARCRGK